MKKLLLVTIIALVFVSGTIVGAMPFASANKVPGPPQIARHLEHIADMLSRANERLLEISTLLEADPAPTQDPAVQAQLASISTTAQSILTTANGLLSCGPTSCNP
jgi:hypothetical protein